MKGSDAESKKAAVEMYDATAPAAKEIARQWSDGLGFESTLARGYLDLEAELDRLREALREAKRYVCQTFPDETNRLELCREISAALAAQEEER